MKWTEAEVRRLQQMIYQYNIASLDQVISASNHDNSDDEHSLMDIVGTIDDLTTIEKQQTIQTLLKYVKRLRPREQYVIIHRFGLETGEYMTLDEVGKTLGITRERIRQVESKAIRHLRKMMIHDGILTIDDI